MDINDAHGPDSSTLTSAKDATPGTPPPPQPSTNGSDADIKVEVGYSLFTTIYVILAFVFYVAFSYGAAKLSYDKYRSVGWAIVDFFFSTFYYPYYAIVLNAPTYIGGRR